MSIAHKIEILYINRKCNFRKFLQIEAEDDLWKYVEDSIEHLADPPLQAQVKAFCEYCNLHLFKIVIFLF